MKQNSISWFLKLTSLFFTFLLISLQHWLRNKCKDHWLLLVHFIIHFFIDWHVNCGGEVTISKIAPALTCFSSDTSISPIHIIARLLLDWYTSGNIHFCVLGLCKIKELTPFHFMHEPGGIPCNKHIWSKCPPSIWFFWCCSATFHCTNFYLSIFLGWSSSAV